MELEGEFFAGHSFGNVNEKYGALPIDWVSPLRDRVDEIWVSHLR